jgi:hypothetical protein
VDGILITADQVFEFMLAFEAAKLVEAHISLQIDISVILVSPVAGRTEKA